jgi:hypothetical protein
MAFAADTYDAAAAAGARWQQQVGRVYLIRDSTVQQHAVQWHVCAAAQL